MTDKEVGEMWIRTEAALNNGHSALWAKAVIDLIRKIVEERARRAAIATGNTEPFIKKALRDFGIDPETFK